MLRLRFIDDIDSAFTPDYFVIGANFFDAGAHLHIERKASLASSLPILIFAVGYPTLRQIVRCQFNLNAVTWHQPNVIFAHLAGQVGDNLMAVLKLEPKVGAR